MQSSRILRNHCANKLRRNTQINYANHYADYAIITQFNYADTITQFLKLWNIITQITQIPNLITQKFFSLRNGQLADVLHADGTGDSAWARRRREPPGPAWAWARGRGSRRAITMMRTVTVTVTVAVHLETRTRSQTPSFWDMPFIFLS